MIQIVKVCGDSLAPEIRHGDYVITSSLPVRLGRLHVGDIVMFEHPIYGMLIKRISALTGKSVEVRGFHQFSIDSRRFGALPLTCVKQKMLFHVAA